MRTKFLDILQQAEHESSGCIDKLMTYEDYIHDDRIKEQRAKMYGEA